MYSSRPLPHSHHPGAPSFPRNFIHVRDRRIERGDIVLSSHLLQKQPWKLARHLLLIMVSSDSCAEQHTNTHTDFAVRPISRTFTQTPSPQPPLFPISDCLLSPVLAATPTTTNQLPYLNQSPRPYPKHKEHTLIPQLTMSQRDRPYFTSLDHNALVFKIGKTESTGEAWAADNGADGVAVEDAGEWERR